MQRMLACSEVLLMYARHDAWRRIFNAAEKRADNLAGDLDGIDAKLDRCASPLVSKGNGVRDPKVQCEQRDRQALIACLAPSRRAELRMFSFEQYGARRSFRRRGMEAAARERFLGQDVGSSPAVR